jgi:hypothetical protein
MEYHKKSRRGRNFEVFYGGRSRENATINCLIWCYREGRDEYNMAMT